MLDVENNIKPLPIMPEILSNVFELIKNSKNLVEDLANEISKHQDIEKAVLKIANSRYFALAQEIKTIQQAIVFLGVMRVKNIILALSLKEMLCPNNYKDLYKHSLMCGLATKALAERTKTINPDDAFAVGFMHDIGKVVLYDDMENELEKTKKSLESDVIENENNMFQTNHCTMGAMILKRWRLPNIIIDCIKYHHAPTLSALPAVCGLVYISDILSSEGNFDNKLYNMALRLGMPTLDSKSINLMVRTKAEAIMETIETI